MITPMAMHDAVCDFLESEVAARFELKAVDRKGSETFRNPQVIRSGRILPKSIDEIIRQDEEFPFIVTRFGKIKNVKDARESTVTLYTLFGVYGPGVYDGEGALVDDGSGYRDFWNLVEATRRAFFTHLTIANKFRVHDDYFEAEMIQERIYPYWEGYCKTKWDIAYPLPELDDHFL